MTRIPRAADSRSVLVDDALDGRTALVTGAGGGIGRAVALDLAAAGADLVLVGRTLEPLDAVADEVRALGRRALVVTADVRDEEQVAAAVTEALDAFGAIDVLVNNAGGQFMAPAEEITPKGWRAVHRLAVDGGWSVTREVARRSMIPNRGGVVFFIGFSPRRGIPGMVHASAARAALETLATGLSLEWSRYGVRVLCVDPGTIETPALAERYDEASRREWAAGVPLGRLGSPWDVSALVAFLATPAASYVTGTHVLVDGGADAWGAGRRVPEAVA